jgi:hypothetical protein
MRRVTAAEWPWDPECLLHRQMYIDLISAYLADYGTRRDLARALGVSEAFLSYLLQSPRLTGRPPPAHWTVLMAAAGCEVADALRFAKTPSQVRASQIADRLVSDDARREILLYHVSRARGRAKPDPPQPQRMSPETATRSLQLVGDVHQDALHHSAEAVAADSYARVWRLARNLPARIDPRRHPVDHARALMFLHDTAQVLGRPDLALGFARRALSVLPADGRAAAVAPGVARLRINALLAEAVSLNTLGLRAQAWRVAQYAEAQPGYRDEPHAWLRSFLEQRLTAMAGLPRASLYHAESTADRAQGLVTGDRVLQAGITRRLLDVYLTRLTPRSSRKAAALAADLGKAAPAERGMSPLRHAQILRTLARHHFLTGEGAAATALVGECLRLTTEANLIGQRTELIREFAARRPPAEARPSALRIGDLGRH